MADIKNVVFDLGGVMINWNPRELVRSLGYDNETVEALCKAVFLSPMWPEMDRGVFPSYKEAVEYFVSKNPELESQIRAFFHPSWMEIYTVKEDTESILFNWACERANVYVLTNFAADGFEYVYNKYPFFKKIKGYICSAYEHCIKPEKKIYSTLLDRFSLVPEETVFIDDVSANVQGAVDMGIHGIQFTTPEEVKEKLISLGL